LKLSELLIRHAHVLKLLKESGFDIPLVVPSHRRILLVLGGKVTDVDEFLRPSFSLSSQ
jgi:hypothetical protein